ncbi:MAG TPA: hypothetical protein VFU87_04325 [Sphingomicrobium sp.]|nr:hypothetical protein [Sphingomicrobium sp.]
MSELRKLVAEELSLPVDPRVSAMAEAIAARHEPASRAVLFYGSCLRERELEGRMLDFYLIVSDYRAAYAKRWLALANRLIPPNVFYFEKDGLSAKYAVLSEADFARECSPTARTVSTAARFAQPSRLVWTANERAAERATEIVGQAVPSLLGWTLSAAPGNVTPLALWKRAFQLTFGAELRAERTDRSAQIVDADPERYERFANGARMLVDDHAASGPRWWRSKQLKGKLYSIARLAKASATFSGGADYIAWKINRHAGTAIELKPWQRRHPLLAGITLLPRLLKSGAVR